MSDEKTLSELVKLDQWISVLIHWAAYRTREQFEKALEPFAIDSKHFGTLALLITDGPLSQVDLWKRQRVDRTSMVAIVDYLERNGLVTRSRHPTDRRALLITITDAGRTLMQEAATIAHQSEDAFLESLSMAERAQLQALLLRLLD